MKSLLLPVGSWLRAVGLALLPLASAWAGSVQVEVRDAAADKPWIRRWFIWSPPRRAAR